MTAPRPGARLLTVAFTVRASQAQARRWVRVAHYLGCRSVSAWLEELAEEQAARWDEATRPAADLPCRTKDEHEQEAQARLHSGQRADDLSQD